MVSRLLSFSQYLAEKRITDGVFGAVTFDAETERNLQQFVKDAGIPNPNKELHTTIIYSRKKIDFPVIGKLDEPVIITPETYSFALFGEKKDTLVLKYKSEFLHMRWKLAMDLGATYDFPTYLPHATLSYDVPADFDLKSLKKPTFNLVIVEEYVKILTDD